MRAHLCGMRTKALLLTRFAIANRVVRRHACLCFLDVWGGDGRVSCRD